jgi:hypothetical protein
MGGNGTPSKKSPRKVDVPIGRPGKDPCDISFTTPLAHVRTAQTADLKAGVMLQVEVETIVNRKTLVCKRRGNREIVGFILARGAANLIDCIEEGHEYAAEIKKVDFGLVEVAVRRTA